MLRNLRDIFKIPELRRRILFTIALLVVYRIGGHVPTPGINGEALATFFATKDNTLFGLYDMFVGGAFKKVTVFALGIMPYISASIILQLLTAVFPYFEKLKKEGEEGQKKITQYTRYGTVFLALIQAYGISVFIESITLESGASVVHHPGIGFRLLTMLTLAAGTVFIMWLGEQISEHGIGNGISLIIFVGIVARLPGAILKSLQMLRYGQLNIFHLLFIGAIIVGVTAMAVLITQGQRKIPVQYAKQIRGRKVYGGQTTHIPLRINTAGVIPIIFAQSIIMFPATIASFIRTDFMQDVAAVMQPGEPLYMIIFALMIVFFAYFYTAIVFNPVDLAENMKKHGGFIPGVRPGKRTSDYIDRVLTRITLPGSIFLALIAILPFFLISSINVPFYFGGTGLLIVVGVALDTLRQVETHLLMRHYDGFMKKGKIRGRR
jgi:preprotein translocase subunit SecY